ncbi:MAG TPA: [acyl-carrier-protein] S-malonyltransferase [Thermodesulforhabdus norvegica]|uniref:Malonyl CoA-acyl carrier protein transacylase n=1 Tax=Thermodesulforhabdus norvegica TaxID=39841 RepID=A0A7C0WRQ6_9BACT|nr:[acyl-carrier-protein] S-malonyltransferase [Thermodesulforhabdus norvegica]
MEKWVFMFPGQGSQYVGMGREFYESYEEVRRLFHEASEMLGMDMIRLCFEGPEDELTMTENVHPAITVMNLACFKILELHDIVPVASIGHSLGEYCALYAAGVLNMEDLLTLVRARGKLMQEAAERHPGGMIAVMGAPNEAIETLCRGFGLEIANLNSPNQIILTGPKVAIEKATMDYEKYGIKNCIRLNVSGPWHSSWMSEAAEKFREVLEKCRFLDPSIPVVSNVDARPISSGAEAKEKLALQIVKPVRWIETVQWLVQKGYTNFVEVGPKRVLCGLVKKIHRKATVKHVEDPSTLAEFLLKNKKGNEN